MVPTWMPLWMMPSSLPVIASFLANDAIEQVGLVGKRLAQSCRNRFAPSLLGEQRPDEPVKARPAAVRADRAEGHGIQAAHPEVVGSDTRLPARVRGRLAQIQRLSQHRCQHIAGVRFGRRAVRHLVRLGNRPAERHLAGRAQRVAVQKRILLAKSATLCPSSRRSPGPGAEYQHRPAPAQPVADCGPALPAEPGPPAGPSHSWRQTPAECQAVVSRDTVEIVPGKPVRPRAAAAIAPGGGKANDSPVRAASQS